MPRRREDEDEEDVPEDEPRGRRRDDEDDDEPRGRRRDDEAEEEEEPRPRRPRRRKKRRRPIARPPAEESSGFTIQGGWLDSIFGADNVLILLALCAIAFFFCPCMFPVALFAAITAADPDARKNALIVLGVCILVVICSGIAGGLKHAGH
jgi:hypothetical protein